MTAILPFNSHPNSPQTHPWGFLIFSHTCLLVSHAFLNTPSVTLKLLPKRCQNNLEESRSSLALEFYLDILYLNQQ
ncbi:hypothetical protein [Stenomitos frigidus]|uniref:hypothetical protein n=1 Tax=Stenomitos frigidus TaxID=1886765 RepID=UPI0011B25856|nr:hypothetical protein [Stenomitos frigidus]